MTEAIVSKLIDISPTIFAIIVVVVVVWKIANFYFTRFKSTEYKVDNLPCKERHDYMSDMKNDISSLRASFEELKTVILATNDKVRNVYSVKQSPRQLNEMGNRLYGEFKGEEFLMKNKERLFKAIDAKQPKTALDVEIVANEVLICLLNDEMFNPLKDWVYNSPSQMMVVDGREVAHSISMQEVCFILSLPLRDLYLQENPISAV